MKTSILYLLFGITTTFCFAQKERIEVKMADCLFQSYEDKGEALQKLLSDHEQLLIDENILEDSSGKSYRKAYENQMNSKNIKLPSKLFMNEFSKLKSLDVDKRAKCIEDTQKDSLKYDYSKFSKFQSIMAETEGMSVSNPVIGKRLHFTLSDEDLELDFYKIVTYAIMQTIDAESGIKRKLPEIEEKQYSETDLNNAFKIHVNSDSETVIDDKVVDLKKIKSQVVAYLKTSTSTPIISLTVERETLYQTYIAVQNEIVAAYNFVRNELAQDKYNTTYDKLTKEQAEEIRIVYPKNLIEGNN